MINQVKGPAAGVKHSSTNLVLASTIPRKDMAERSLPLPAKIMMAEQKGLVVEARADELTKGR